MGLGLGEGGFGSAWTMLEKVKRNPSKIVNEAILLSRGNVEIG